MPDLLVPELLDRLRTEPPLVHCITNYVSMDVAANAVLAVGASPAMVHAREEAAEFAGLASSVVLNIGTLSPPWVDAMVQAGQVARERGIPIVLDPVAAGATRLRRQACDRILDVGVDVIRANASEVRALAERGLATGRGVDATDSVDDARGAAEFLARAASCVVAMTGARDLVTDGERTFEVVGGHPLMAKVTALGCALSAVVGAFAAVSSSSHRMAGAVTALAVFAHAGRKAGSEAHGPGSFRTAWMDALHRVSPDDLARVPVRPLPIEPA